MKPQHFLPVKAELLISSEKVVNYLQGSLILISTYQMKNSAYRIASSRVFVATDKNAVIFCRNKKFP